MIKYVYIFNKYLYLFIALSFIILIACRHKGYYNNIKYSYILIKFNL